MMLHKLISFVIPRIILFTGGTAANAYTEALNKRTSNLTYIIPISDNGGSSGEIQSYIGGPAIGDIRSRIIRLAEESPMKTLLQYRLPSTKEEEDPFTTWNDILYMKHPIWKEVPTKFRHIIRAGLNTFNATLQTKADISRQFDFTSGAIGNFFFSGERLHFGSLSATIEIFKHVLGINKNTLVIPVVDVNKRLTIGIKMINGDDIKGQNQISHPSTSTSINKNNKDPLPAKVAKLEYIDKDYNAFVPDICEDVIPEINKARTICYSIGSFYTSLLPNLILPGVGEAIKNNSGKKVLILNGSYDRETTYLDAEGNKHKLSISEILEQLKDALNRYGEVNNAISDYVTDIIYLETGEIQPTKDDTLNGITIHKVSSDSNNLYHYNSEELSKTLVSLN